MNLCDNLAFFRMKEDWSQQKLGRLVGVTRRTIERWEKGENTPQPQFLEKLCTLFHLSIERFLGYAPVTDNTFSDRELALVKQFRRMSSENRAKVEQFLARLDIPE